MAAAPQLAYVLEQPGPGAADREAVLRGQLGRGQALVDGRGALVATAPPWCVSLTVETFVFKMRGTSVPRCQTTGGDPAGSAATPYATSSGGAARRESSTRRGNRRTTP